MQNDNILPQTIVTTGTGEVLVTPDIAYVTVKFTNTASTSAEAGKYVSDKITEVTTAAKSNGISDDGVAVLTFTIRADYERVDGGLSRYKGQQCSSTVKLTVNDVGDKGANVSRLVSAVSSIEGIGIDSITYDLKNDTEAYQKVRIKAVEASKNKAELLASLTGLQIAKPTVIIDSMAGDPGSVRNDMMAKSVGFSYSNSNSVVNLVPQDVTITATVTIYWAVK